ncbi:hypothetical protein [uncultured Erythrobacter sp.]|uniref:hypothetical protein n=1 Tax=uncultured Erythrobacter sp. TaxID=263913 RepID=UPI002604AD32|nr:hypothetical protein [uncultured Erythrobacter sp.]
MFSDKLKARFLGLALVGAVLAVPGAASAGVVVKSSGPSAGEYPVGRQVADEASITLRAGDKITVLTDDGTRVMQGPGTFRVGEGATRTRARFSNLTRQRAARRVRTGAVRSGATGAPARSPNLWFVNVAAAGNVCLYDLGSVRLWRPEATEAQTYQIRDAASQGSLEVSFVESEAVRALDPNGLPITDGGNYTITAPAGEDSEAASVNVTFVTMDEEYAAPDALAQALIDNGCTTQLALLADTLEASAE